MIKRITKEDGKRLAELLKSTFSGMIVFKGIAIDYRMAARILEALNERESKYVDIEYDKWQVIGERR